MEINSLFTQGTNYLASTVSNTKSDSSDKVSSSKENSEAEKLKAFKHEFWKKVDSMPYNKGISVSVQITDGAFKRMMKDPKFKEDMINTLNEDAVTSNLPPIGTVLTRIDENGYSGYSYCQENEAAFTAHSSGKDSFYSKKAKKKHNHEAELKRMYQQKMIDKQYYEKLNVQFKQNYVSKQYGKNAGLILNNI